MEAANTEWEITKMSEISTRHLNEFEIDYHVASRTYRIIDKTKNKAWDISVADFINATVGKFEHFEIVPEVYDNE